MQSKRRGANTRFHGKALSTEDIVFERAGVSPESVGRLKTALAHYSNQSFGNN